MLTSAAAASGRPTVSQLVCTNTVGDGAHDVPFSPSAKDRPEADPYNRVCADFLLHRRGELRSPVEFVRTSTGRASPSPTMPPQVCTNLLVGDGLAGGVRGLNIKTKSRKAAFCFQVFFCVYFIKPHWRRVSARASISAFGACLRCMRRMPSPARFPAILLPKR